MAEVKWLTNGMVDSGDTTGEFPAEAQVKNPELVATVEAVNPLKKWLGEYVGGILKPADGNVTVEMIVHAMGVEFPEFLLAIAEENWMRGYAQALHDAELGQGLLDQGKVEINLPETDTTTKDDAEAG